MTYALDTNIVTYFLKGDKSIIDRVSDEADKGNIIVIPPIVFYEIKRWLLTLDAKKKMSIFETMYSISGISVIDKEILEAASVIYSNLRKKGIVIDDNDILIATYCIHHNFILATNNEKHFKHIANLNTVNWI